MSMLLHHSEAKLLLTIIVLPPQPQPDFIIEDYAPHNQHVPTVHAAQYGVSVDIVMHTVDRIVLVVVHHLLLHRRSLRLLFLPNHP